jgi:hypothetical protein
MLNEMINFDNQLIINTINPFLFQKNLRLLLYLIYSSNS